jgi:AcrR family transcriptional regulator
MGQEKMATRKNMRWTAALPTQEEQYQLKRRALIREAGKAFSRKGFHNTSMDDVAKVLNVTKPALYYYIKTKQEILYECHAYALDLGEQAKNYAFAASESPLQRLYLLLTRYIELLTGSFGSYAALLEPISSLTPEDREVIRARLREFDKVFVSLIEGASARGEIAPCDPKLMTAFFMGAINNISRWFSPNGRLTGAEISEVFGRFIMTGLVGDRAAAELLTLPPRARPAGSDRSEPQTHARAPEESF